MASFKKFMVILICLILLILVVFIIVFLVRGNIKNEKLPEGFDEKITKSAFEKTGDVRIMSSNLLVHYESWGGKPAKSRSKMYIALLEKYKPDVVGLQEMSDSWFCCIMNNLPKGYKMINPLTTGALVRMTSMIYNSDTLELLKSGEFTYSKCENKRLRRVVWAQFKEKGSGKTFIVTNTHFSLLFDGKEEEFAEIMRTQAKELSNLIYKLNNEYSCPVFSVGDYNTMEDKPETQEIDIPEIYNFLESKFVDTKYEAETKLCGSEVSYDYPAWDHIFRYGNAKTKTFCLLSDSYFSDMSDHYSIFADVEI